MSRRDPKRLRLIADSALERRALASAAEEEPSPELSNRMAGALGVSAIGGAAVASAAASATASKAAAGAAAGTSIVPWISAGVVVAVVAGAIVGSQLWRSSVHPSPPVAPTVAPTPPATVEVPAATTNAPVVERAVHPEVTPAPPTRRARAMANPPDLRDQTSLVDATRNALASGAADKALDLVRQYQERYPGGIFGPEVAALKIESLVGLGRRSEARTLAERFVASHGPGPLTERVQAVAGLTRP